MTSHSRIHALSEHVVRQIAAGEVIERAASVAKELIENSIDAGSRRIALEIEGSGKRLIRVADDGCGMSREDALLSLERHTTSKISSADDLETLSTFGFRGEALPSIASISKMEIVSRSKENPHAVSILLEGGKIQETKECGRDIGTTIEVRELFFNTPARLKFLKSDGTERSRILRTLEEIAIAHHGISFTLKSDAASKTTSHFPSRKRALERISDLWGENFTEETLFPISVSHPLIRIEGWLSKPESTQAAKSFQIFYVNQRPVLSRSLSHALYESYRDCLPVGRHPAAVIFIALDPSQVDVNVHPSKREVRFRNESQIYEALIKEIRLKRTQFSGAPKVFADSRPAVPLQTFEHSHKPYSPSDGTTALRPEIKHDASAEKIFGFEPRAEMIERPDALSERPRVLSQFSSLYVIAEKEGDLIIVDQHAAGERILYEEFKNALKNEIPVQSQMLLIPVIWNVSLRQAELLKSHLALFHKLGFILEIFGEKTYRVTEAPASIPESGLKTALDEILSALESPNQTSLAGEEKIMRAACRAAVKANDHLSHQELSALLQRLYRCGNPHTCPHGRPTTLTISRQELDKKFGRT